MINPLMSLNLNMLLIGGGTVEGIAYLREVCPWRVPWENVPCLRHSLSLSPS